MRIGRPLGAMLALGLLLTLGLAPTALADHCGGGATVTPALGPPGTTFVFETNLGQDTFLHVYRDGQLVRTGSFQTPGPVRYLVHTHASDAGHWRIEASLGPGWTMCGSIATFDVLDVPDTATQADGAQGPWAAMSLAGFVGGLYAVWRAVRPLPPLRPGRQRSR